MMKAKAVPEHCKKIKKRLIDINMTQRELAYAVGMRESYLCDILKGLKAGTKYLDKIYEVLDMREKVDDMDNM